MCDRAWVDKFIKWPQLFAIRGGLVLVLPVGATFAAEGNCVHNYKELTMEIY